MSATLDAIKSKSKKGLNKAKGALGIQTAPSEDSNVVDEIAEFCPKLSYQQRMIGFGSCFFLGYVITFMSFNFFIDLIEGNPVPFVMLYCKLKNSSIQHLSPQIYLDCSSNSFFYSFYSYW